MTVPPTLADAADAVERIRAATVLLGRVRNVEITVRVMWQQLDELEGGQAESLADELAAATRRWLVSQRSLATPGVRIRVNTEHAADIMTLQMALPHIVTGEPAEPG